MATRAMVFQRARLRPFAGATLQAFDKDLTVAVAPWRDNAANNSAAVYGGSFRSASVRVKTP